MKKVAMKVNQANLVKSLKYSFTNRTTVLGELLQNARRAGATQVVFEFAPETKTLKVVDDGCGIESIETLLTVAESGWDADVVAQEHPFGLGFISALFACRHLTVVSKSGQISVDTEEVLSFEPVTVNPVSDWDGLTVISMAGVDIDAEKLAETLKKLAKGFPIPVSINGKALGRPHALDSGVDFTKSEIGLIHLANRCDPKNPAKDFEVYLQGLPIFRSSRFCFGDHVIHLDSSKFFARLPDRDKLVDESEVAIQIQEALKAEAEKWLYAEKQRLPSGTFVEYFETLKHWGLLALLNDVDVVPVDAFQIIESYPVCDTDIYGCFEERPKAPLTRAEVKNRQVELVICDGDIRSDGAARLMFAWMRGSYLYQDNLDEGHWLHPYVRDLDSEALAIECVNESAYVVFDGSWVNIGVQFCDSYRIKIGDDVVDIDNHACYLGYDRADFVVMPKAGLSSAVIEQVATFKTEFDEYQVSTHDDDCDKFFSFLVANTANNPADALKQLLGNFKGCPALFGKSFILNLDASGNITYVAQA